MDFEKRRFLAKFAWILRKWEQCSQILLSPSRKKHGQYFYFGSKSSFGGKKNDKDICQHIGISKGGETTKIHALVDALGYTVKILQRAWNVNDITIAPKLIANLKLKGSIVLDDKASTKFIHQIHMWSVGELTNINTGKFFKLLKDCRRIATRYDKIARRFLAFVHFASILILLR